MPKYDLYNFDINSDVIILYFAASFDNFYLIEHYEHPKMFSMKIMYAPQIKCTIFGCDWQKGYSWYLRKCTSKLML